MDRRQIMTCHFVKVNDRNDGVNGESNAITERTQASNHFNIARVS